MQFDMIAHPNLDLRHCALVFDPEVAAKAQFKNSSEAMKGFDASSLSLSAIGYYASETLVKLKLYVDEQPPSEVVKKANRKSGNCIFHAVSGTLCAGWVTHAQKNEQWIHSLPNEEHNGFAGDFKQIAPGRYSVEIYSLLEALPPPRPPSPTRWYNFLVGCAAITAIALFMITATAMSIGAPIAAVALRDWRYLLLALPHVLFIGFLYWSAKREPKFWKRMADKYLAMPPDVAVVLMTLPPTASFSEETPAYLIRPGAEKEAESRRRHMMRAAFSRHE